MLELVVGVPELAMVERRLLEVIAEDLVELDEAASPLEPAGKACVQLSACLLRERVVGRVADQEVAEPVRLVIGEILSFGPDQLLAYEADEIAVDRHAG